ncbi:MAG: SCP2 sterol-binding domain-containing protein [Promethearchaeota archaeon]
MVKVGTQEWLDAYREALNNNPAYMEAAGPKGFPPNGWEGDFAFVIEPSGPLDHTIYQFIGLYHGECTDAKIMNEDDFVFVKPGEKAPEGKLAVEFIYSAKYDNWIPILKNELDGTKALLMGKAKLKGDMAKVMRAVKAAQELTRTAASLDTEFL